MREISKKEEGRGLRGAFIKKKGQGNDSKGKTVPSDKPQ
jgi:hypothetical protein